MVYSSGGSERSGRRRLAVWEQCSSARYIRVFMKNTMWSLLGCKNIVMSNTMVYSLESLFYSLTARLGLAFVSTRPEPVTANHERISNIAAYVPPPSRLVYKLHPLETQVSEQVNGYFLKHWPFETAKARKKFVAAGFSRVTCFYFPLAKEDRIYHACKLLTILFLIDDILEDMSFESGAAYNNTLIPIARGDVQPDRSVPAQWMMYDLWEDMRACDKELADDILEPVFTFMRAQTDKARLSISEMGEYLVYRERDVGKALLCALGRFSMELRLTPDELDSVQPIEKNCAKHLSVVNDILSWDKEHITYLTGHPEGSALCSAVQVLSNETSLPYPACKRVLWVLCREWEAQHDVLVEKLASGRTLSPKVLKYIKSLEYQISGNEQWSVTTLRYNFVAPAEA